MRRLPVAGSRPRLYATPMTPESAREYGRWSAWSFLPASLEAVVENSVFVRAELGIKSPTVPGRLRNQSPQCSHCLIWAPAVSFCPSCSQSASSKLFGRSSHFKALVTGSHTTLAFSAILGPVSSRLTASGRRDAIGERTTIEINWGLLPTKPSRKDAQHFLGLMHYDVDVFALRAPTPVCERAKTLHKVQRALRGRCSVAKTLNSKSVDASG